MVEVHGNDLFHLLAGDGGTATAGARREVLTSQVGRKEVSPLTCVGGLRPGGHHAPPCRAQLPVGLRTVLKSQPKHTDQFTSQVSREAVTAQASPASHR